MSDPNRITNDYTKPKTSSRENEKRPSRAPNTIEKPKKPSVDAVKRQKMKKARRKMYFRNIRNVTLIMIVVVGISAFLASVAISCVNDLLVVNIKSEENIPVSVEIRDGMTTNDVVDALAEAGAIKNAWFCKFAASFIGYSDEGYIPRTYSFLPSMGLENMLNEIKNLNSSTAQTVKITFPEGYTADQIFALLEENNVCTRAKLIETMRTTDFSADFEFLKSMADTQNRYMLLEGYLYPDTYEFYVGEGAESVIKKFLNNFDRKWTDDYAVKTQQKRMTVDQIIKLASIVEKESVGADMPVVGSILFNRIEANMRLECDSTSIYLDSNLSGLTETEIAVYNTYYDTYQCMSLPVGAICNPGDDAISAVLNAPDTDYYYFIHDSNNIFRPAKSLSEQNYNISTYGVAQS